MHFLNLNFELAQMNKAQRQDIIIGYKQSLYKILASNHFQLQDTT